MAADNIDYENLKKRGFLRQRQEGFFILRTRMRSGVYKDADFEKLSGIARKYGKGILHATVRQGIEIPFIRQDDIPGLERELAAAGISAGTSGARLRATTVCPGTNWCRFGLIDTFALAEKIEKLGITCGLDLPHKFKIAISGCPNGCTRPQFAEIGIHGQAADAGKGAIYTVYLGGNGGRQPRTGLKIEKALTEGEALSVVERTVRFFKERGRPRQRLGALIEETGAEAFKIFVVS